MPRVFSLPYQVDIFHEYNIFQKFHAAHEATLVYLVPMAQLTQTLDLKITYYHCMTMLLGGMIHLAEKNANILAQNVREVKQ